MKQYTDEELLRGIRRALNAGNTSAATELTTQLTKPPPMTGGDVARGALQGATFSFGDEARAGANAAFNTALSDEKNMGFGDYYSLYRDDERQRMDAFRRNHPVAAFASEMAGGAATGALGGAKAATTNVGKRLLAKPLLTRMAVSSGIGGGTGALFGAGEAKEMADIPGAMLAPAAAGMVLPPLAELGASGFQRTIGAIKRNMNPKRRAANALRKTLDDAGDTPRMAATRARTMGNGTIMADTSEAAKQKLSTLVQAPGKTRQSATTLLRRRSEQQGDDLMAALGPAEKIRRVDDLRAIRKSQSSPLYEKAFNKGVEHTEELEQIFKTLETTDPGIWRKAKRTGIRRLAGDGIDINAAELGDARPSLRGWQAMKEHLDNLEGLGRRAGGESRSFGNMRRRLLTELDRQNPDYKKARELWAGTKGFEDAIDDGTKILRNSSAVVEERLKDASLSEREAYRVGAVQAIFDRLENMGLTHDASKIFRTKGMERRLTALFGDDKAGYEEFIKRMTASAEQQATYTSATSGSRTAAHLLGDEDTLAPDISSILYDITRGASPTGAIAAAGAGLVGKIGRKAGDVIRGDRAVRDELGRLLLMTPSEIEGLLPSIAHPPPLPRTTGAGLLTPIVLGTGAGLLTAPDERMAR